MEKTVELATPIEFGSQVINKLTFRSIKGKDLRKISLARLADMDFGQALDLAGRLSGQPPEFMDMLEGNDVIKVTMVIFDFLSAMNPKLS
jgi:hypothetical protein